MVGTADYFLMLVMEKGYITLERYGMALAITIMIISNANIHLDNQERLQANWNSSPVSRQWKLAINNLCFVLFSTRKSTTLSVL